MIIMDDGMIQRPTVGANKKGYGLCRRRQRCNLLIELSSTLPHPIQTTPLSTGMGALSTDHSVTQL